MSRILPLLALSAALSVPATAPFAQQADPAPGGRALDERQCMTLVLAMSKLELSMVGKAGMPAQAVRDELGALQPGLPDEVSDRIDALLQVAAEAEGIAPGDPAHPMATGTFQEASRAYREALAPHCPGFEMDY